MAEGGEIRIATQQVNLAKNQVSALPEGIYVQVCVHDNGSGIDPEILPHILEPFYTTKEIGKGTGLGLSQVFGFVTQSNGDMGIHSHIGKGTTISLYFPVMAHCKETDVINTQEDIKVLIVDDEPEILGTATELFKSMGYEVLTASSGEIAIETLLDHQDIGVLFSDILMPGGMNGIQLAQEVRQIYPNIQIILASGYPLPALKAEYNELNDFLFLNKPYRLADLAKCLRTARMS